MSADEPLVKRIEGMLERAREAREIAQYSVEDAVGKLQSLEAAHAVAVVLAELEAEAHFEVTVRTQPKDGPNNPSTVKGTTINVTSGYGPHTKLRALVMALLQQQATDLAGL